MAYTPIPKRPTVSIEKQRLEVDTEFSELAVRTEVQQIAAQLSFTPIGLVAAVVVLACTLSYTRLSFGELFGAILPFNTGAIVNTGTINNFEING